MLLGSNYIFGRSIGIITSDLEVLNETMSQEVNTL